MQTVRVFVGTQSKQGVGALVDSKDVKQGFK